MRGLKLRPVISSCWKIEFRDKRLDSPNHDDCEVQYVPGVPEVGSRVKDKAEGDDSHDALRGEDYGEDDLDLLQKVIGGIAVTVWKWCEDSERYAGTQNC